MKRLLMIAALTLTTLGFAQTPTNTPDNDNEGTNIMGSGSKSAEGPAINNDDTKYKNLDQQKMEEFKKEDPTPTNATEGETSIKVE